jgi:hypothetical protein
MDYPEKDIYTEIIEALKEKEYYFISKAHPIPAHYDWDRGQYEPEGERTDFPFNRPAIFIQFGDMDYEPSGGYTKRGTIPITVTCVQDKYVDAMEGATTQPEFKKILEWKYLVNDVLDGFKGVCFSRLYMVQINPDHDNKNLHVEKIQYECRVTLRRNVIPPP